MSQTSSIRIDEDLHDRLKRLARRTNRKKNWLILRAIQEFLDRYDQELISAEARRQSLLASQQSHPDDEFWPQLADDSGWN